MKVVEVDAFEQAWICALSCAIMILTSSSNGDALKGIFNQFIAVFLAFYYLYLEVGASKGVRFSCGDLNLLSDKISNSASL